MPSALSDDTANSTALHTASQHLQATQKAAGLRLDDIRSTISRILGECSGASGSMTASADTAPIATLPTVETTAAASAIAAVTPSLLHQTLPGLVQPFSVPEFYRCLLSTGGNSADAMNVNMAHIGTPTEDDALSQQCAPEQQHNMQNTSK